MEWVVIGTVLTCCALNGWFMHKAKRYRNAGVAAYRAAAETYEQTKELACQWQLLVHMREAQRERHVERVS